MEIILKTEELDSEILYKSRFYVQKAFCMILLFKNGSAGLTSETKQAIF